ncbi:MAG TPA: hypothetical protein VGV92_02950 [Gammaproteobacteria bacterium]|nr:hypothetical protein [Gammaproteobacteria bacterium]
MNEQYDDSDDENSDNSESHEDAWFSTMQFLMKKKCVPKESWIVAAAHKELLEDFADYLLEQGAWEVMLSAALNPSRDLSLQEREQLFQKIIFRFNDLKWGDSFTLLTRFKDKLKQVDHEEIRTVLISALRKVSGRNIFELISKDLLVDRLLDNVGSKLLKEHNAQLLSFHQQSAPEVKKYSINDLHDIKKNMVK